MLGSVAGMMHLPVRPSTTSQQIAHICVAPVIEVLNIAIFFGMVELFGASFYTTVFMFNYLNQIYPIFLPLQEI